MQTQQRLAPSISTFSAAAINALRQTLIWINDIRACPLKWIQLNHIDEDDPRYERYVELKSLLRIPVIEQVILSKLEELKALSKEEIKSFFEEA